MHLAVDYFHKHVWIFGTYWCKICRFVSKVNMYRYYITEDNVYRQQSMTFCCRYCRFKDLKDAISDNKQLISSRQLDFLPNRIVCRSNDSSNKTDVLSVDSKSKRDFCNKHCNLVLLTCHGSSRSDLFNRHVANVQPYDLRHELSEEFQLGGIDHALVQFGKIGSVIINSNCNDEH